MTISPLLTIFIPVFNGRSYLSQAVESLLEQSFRDFELLIVDDGSTDGTVALAKNLCQGDQRIRLIRGTHAGEVAARNKALAASNPASRYFLNHDSDDISLPEKLEALIGHLEGHSDIAVLGTQAAYFNDRGDDLGSPPIELTPERIRATFHEVNSMINSASMIRRDVFAAIGGYRQDFRSVDDYDFFMRALLAGYRMENLPRILHRIRLHGGSIGTTRSGRQQELAKEIRETYLRYRDASEPQIIHSPLQLSRYFRPVSNVRPSTVENPNSIPARAAKGLRILHTVQMYHPRVGGSEEVVRQISERLVKRGHNVTVATGYAPDRNYSSLNGVDVRQFDISGNPVHGIRGDSRRYQEFLTSSRFDVTMNYAAQIWSSDLVFPVLEKLSGAKVFVPCGYSALFDPAFSGYFEKLPGVLASYDKVIHLSSGYRDAVFSQHHGLANSVVIGNAADEDEFLSPSESFREKYGIKSQHLVITVANHYAGKGHDRVLQWFRELGRPDVTLAIIGNKAPGGCWDECSHAASLLTNVMLLPDLPRKDVVAAYKDADLFWFGSEIECFPLVILEAMASKTPWLSTNVGNLSELPGGIVAAPDHMARKANMLLNSKSLTRRLGDTGFDEWNSRYTWKHIVDQYEELYLSLVQTAGVKQLGTESNFSVQPRNIHKASQEIALCPQLFPDGPMVSVVIPCYKQAHFVTEAIESVLAQTYRNFEIIVVDDGSPDDVRSVVERMIAQHPERKIRLLAQPNQGLSASRNNAIREAAGEYILPLDADDRLRETFMEACIRKIQSDPKVAIVSTHLQEFGETTRTIDCGKPALEQLAIANQINYCSLFPKYLWNKVGGYKSAMRYGFEDWDFWISCLQAGAQIAVVPEHLFLYRKRGDSMFTSATAHATELQAQIVINHPGLYSEDTERWAAAFFRCSKFPKHIGIHRILSGFYVSRNHWKEAIPHLQKLSTANNAGVLFLLGIARMQVRQFSDAIETFRRLLDLQPGHAEAHFLLAIAHVYAGDFRSAASHSEDALEINLRMPEALELLAALACRDQDPAVLEDLKSRANDLRLTIPGQVYSVDESWKEYFYSKFVEKRPTPLLQLETGRKAVSVTEKSGDGVTVILPTFNRPEMLQRAIESVLNQTYTNFEIVVVNDAGCDVEPVVRKLNDGGRITYIRHDRNRGLAASRNTAIRQARCRYISYLDDDDIYYPEHLETLVKTLEKERCEMAYTDACRAHQQMRSGELVTVHRDIPYSCDFDKDRMLIGNFIPVLCVMHERRCFEKGGTFDPTLTTHEDWDLWIRFSQLFRFAHIPRVTCEFSWRTDGATMSSHSQPDFLRTLDIIYKRYRSVVSGRAALIEAQALYRKGLEMRVGPVAEAGARSRRGR